MQELKCDPSAVFSEAQIGDSKLADIALKAYQKHVAHYNTTSDSSKNVTKALGVLSALRSRPDVTKESKKLLKQIDLLVRAKNNYVIKQVMKFENYQSSLFGTNDDINALLETALAHFADRAQKKRGESKLALYNIN